MKRYILLLCMLMAACGELENPIPNYPVHLELDLTTYRDRTLRDVPSSRAYTVKDININIERVGFGGVLVVHATDGLFYAFDLACPHEANRNTLIEADENILNAICPKCGTKYDIAFGSGAPNGVSKNYLKRYTIVEAGTRLTVSN
ncbi:MAG: (2Fe-2S)-binding protein [Tannerella sp.]|jgi:nitrite reductase/ring-hydroxylating ferredoxin subunit|nr:(2Fe-2S)-binding protein [Tannerella sp.]